MTSEENPRARTVPGPLLGFLALILLFGALASFCPRRNRTVLDTSPTRFGCLHRFCFAECTKRKDVSRQPTGALRRKRCNQPYRSNRYCGNCKRCRQSEL